MFDPREVKRFIVDQFEFVESANRLAAYVTSHLITNDPDRDALILLEMAKYFVIQRSRADSNVLDSEAEAYQILGLITKTGIDS